MTDPSPTPARRPEEPDESVRYRCPTCGGTFPLGTPLWRCPHDGDPLDLTPGPGITPDEIDRNEPSLWRYAAALRGAPRPPTTLGEGWTPLVDSAWHNRTVGLKLESLSPTGSFKDRGAAVMIAYLRSIGVRAIAEDSSGNAGAAVATYAAASQLPCRIYVPATASPAKILQIAASGAEVVRVEGSRQEVAEAARREAKSFFYASHNWQALFLEGTKTLAYELWEASGFRAPDSIIVPLGGGSSLLGCFLGFSELLARGQITRLPRLFGAQALACAPIHTAWKAGANDLVRAASRPTIAEGIALARPVRAKAILRAVRVSGGGTVAVEEEEIGPAVSQLARQGFFVEPTSAVAAAGLSRLFDAGTIGPDERTVLVITGHGLKAVGSIGSLLGIGQ